MRRFISTLIVLALAVSLTANVVAINSNSDDVYTSMLYIQGVAPDTENTPVAEYEEVSPTRSIPTSFDNSSAFPSPMNQGSLGSCTACAVTYAAKSNNEFKKRGWTISANCHKFSPSYVYNQLTKQWFWH